MLSISFSRFNLFNLFLGLLTVLLFLPRLSFAQAEQADACEDVLPYAENLFFNAGFEVATEALINCLAAESLIDSEKAEIYLLLARIYFADQRKTPAAEALENLFDLQPDFKPESFLPPPFIQFAEHIQEIHSADEVLDKQLMLLPAISEEKKINHKRWLLISGGGLFAITAVAIMSSGRANTPDIFPPVPGPPSGQ